MLHIGVPGNAVWQGNHMGRVTSSYAAAHRVARLNRKVLVGLSEDMNRLSPGVILFEPDDETGDAVLATREWRTRVLSANQAAPYRNGTKQAKRVFVGTAQCFLSPQDYHTVRKETWHSQTPLQAAAAKVAAVRAATAARQAKAKKK